MAMGLMAGTAVAAPDTGKVFNAEHFMLNNGMQVVLIENHRAPVVTHMVWYRVGAADDPTGKSGIAHFFEHLMFKGTEKIAAGDISKIVARNGGNDNAFTSYDFTAYYQNIAANRLELVMDLESDRMKNLRLAENDVTTERSVVLEERHQTLESNPDRRLQEQANATLFPHHPYGRPIIGWRPEIAGLNKTDADTFYATWYTPNNAILVISGDITIDQLKPLAEKYYGSVPQRAVPERKRNALPEMVADRRVELADANVQQPSLTFSYLAPSYGDSKNEQPYAAQILSQIMGGGATSRLYQQLVNEQKIAADTGTSYHPYAIDAASFDVYAAPIPGKDMAVLEEKLRAAIADTLAKRITDAEVQLAKQKLQASAIYARDSVMHPAYIFGMALTIGQTIDDVETWPQKIDAVTTQQVNELAARLFASPSVISVLRPATPPKTKTTKTKNG